MLQVRKCVIRSRTNRRNKPGCVHRRHEHITVADAVIIRHTHANLQNIGVCSSPFIPAGLCHGPLSCKPGTKQNTKQ